MIGNGERRDVAILHEDDMAVALAVDRPASLLEDPNSVRSAQDGESAHQIVTSTCCVSTVRGIPRSALTSRQAAIAWRTFSIASLRDWPCDTQPGMLGHSAIQMRSSSCVSVMRNFMLAVYRTSNQAAKSGLSSPGGGLGEAADSGGSRGTVPAVVLPWKEQPCRGNRRQGYPPPAVCRIRLTRA